MKKSEEELLRIRTVRDFGIGSNFVVMFQDKTNEAKWLGTCGTCGQQVYNTLGEVAGDGIWWHRIYGYGLLFSASKYCPQGGKDNGLIK